MFKRRFIPYIVGVCVVVLLSISYLSYVSYRADQNFKAFMSDVKALNPSIDGQHDHSSHDHTHHGEGALHPDSTGAGGQTDSRHEHPSLVGHGDYSYNIAGRLYFSDTPMSQKSIEIEEWKLTGKMTPAVEEALRDAKRARDRSLKTEVIQRVVTPDGHLRHVIVPPWMLYEEGDAILQSELDPSELEWAALEQKPWLKTKLVIDGIDYYPPEEFFSIADPYEREEYFKKFDQSIELGISIAEVEKKIAAGELDVSLSESEKRMIDTNQKYIERSRLLAPEPSQLSDKPPVKVRFLPDEGEDARPGWMRK